MTGKLLIAGRLVEAADDAAARSGSSALSCRPHETPDNSSVATEIQIADTLVRNVDMAYPPSTHVVLSAWRGWASAGRVSACAVMEDLSVALPRRSSKVSPRDAQAATVKARAATRQIRAWANEVIASPGTMPVDEAVRHVKFAECVDLRSHRARRPPRHPPIENRTAVAQLATFSRVTGDTRRQHRAELRP